MLKNSDLSELSLLSVKKPLSVPIKRNRSDFESDYRQQIITNPKNLSFQSKKLQSKNIMPITSEQLSLQTKEKILDSNINHSSYNDVFVNEMKQKLLAKSDQIHKCKRISEKVDIYLEQDEKFTDCKALKDVQRSLNDGNIH